MDIRSAFKGVIKKDKQYSTLVRIGSLSPLLRKGLAVLFWAWALGVSLSRVVMGVHCLLDIIGGLLVAVAVGLLWLALHEGVLQALASFSLDVLHIPLW